MTQLFALLTDFGIQDPYVGQIKSVILKEFGQCSFLDISHQILAYNVKQGAFFLAATWSYLPEKTICIAVVDPGVGTNRSILLIAKDGKYLLAPDNGLSSMLFQLPGDMQFWRIDFSQFSGSCSPTFHGRDIFAPLAVKLAQGEQPQIWAAEIGSEEVYKLKESQPDLSDGKIEATVIHIDHFGNCILNLSIYSWSKTLAPGRSVKLVDPQRASVFVRTNYADIPDGQLGIIQGSQYFYELACDQKSCADRLSLEIGDTCFFQL